MKKVMLLAAGRGERLKPLTDTVPKPLISVGPGSFSLIEHNLVQLQSSGIEEVVINVCYRAQQIMEKLGNGRRYGLKITFSYESEKPLGTGGGIFQALRYLGEEPFIVLSSDIWTDYPFETLTLPSHCMAHLVMVKNPDFHLKGDYALRSTGLLDARADPKYTYANIAVLHPKLFKNSVSGFFSLVSLLVAPMKENKVSGELYQGQWFNIGTIKELKRLEQFLN